MKQIQHPLFNQFLGGLLNMANKYFSQPTIQSPVPSKTFPTQFQQDMGNIGRAISGADKFIGSKIPPPPGVPLTKATPRPTMVPTATPTPVPTVQGFTTAPVPPDYAQLINQSAQQHGINPAVLASLLFTEHGFSRDAGINKNPDGSYDRGPAQINSKAHPEITDQQAMNPQFAIPWAAQTLKGYIDQTGSLKNGIAAYNVGPGGATVYGKGGRLGPKGTAYLNKVKQGLAPEIASALGL